MEFKKAARQQAKLRLALSGPSGSGKTFGALKVAKGIGGRVAVIDTERGSASMYSHIFDFDVLELNPPYTPERFIEALNAAKKEKFDVVVIDSMTHEWNGSGGCLEINDTLAGVKYKGNTWAAWNETTPRHRKFVDAILNFPGHIVCTMRSKTETSQEGGKVVKLGMKDEQRDGMDYEFTTVLNIIHANHLATASKDRTGIFKVPHVISEETGARLLEWLNSGVPPVELPKEPEQPSGFESVPEFKSDNGMYLFLANELNTCMTQSQAKESGGPADKIKEAFASKQITPEEREELIRLFRLLPAE